MKVTPEQIKKLDAMNALCESHLDDDAQRRLELLKQIQQGNPPAAPCPESEELIGDLLALLGGVSGIVVRLTRMLDAAGIDIVQTGDHILKGTLPEVKTTKSKLP